MAKGQDNGSESTGALYQQIPNEAVSLTIAGIAFASLCYRLVDNVALLVWLAIIIGTIGVRLWSSKRYRAVSRATSHRQAWSRTFVAGAAIIGVAFGVLAILAIRNADQHQATLISLWIAIMAVCAIPIYNARSVQFWALRFRQCYCRLRHFFQSSRQPLRPWVY